MTFPWTEVQWGPFWLPGLYDNWTNWPSIKMVGLTLFIIFYRYCSYAKPRIFYSKVTLYSFGSTTISNTKVKSDRNDLMGWLPL